VSYQPKHQRQLNGTATAGEDCGVRSTSMAIDFATKGKTVPTVLALRTRMGVKAGSTTTADQKKGAESYDTKAETGGRKPIKANRQVGVPFDTFVPALKNGNVAVVLSLSYKVVNNKKPNLSGDRAFNGSHSVMFLGSRTASGGGTEVLSWDSLYDGRRTGIPKGPQWWPLWLVEDACNAFAAAAGSGKATGLIIPTPALLSVPAPTPPPTPEPEPPDLPDVPDLPNLPTKEQEMENALNEERTALVDFIVAAQLRIEDLDRINPPNTQQALAVVVDGQSPEEPEG
jgi:hypothetical protein